MNHPTWGFGVALVCVLGMQVSPVMAAEKQPVVVVAGPTIIAFFPVTKAELQNDADTNEALADFQFYAKQVREPLRKAGIEFSEVYAHSFRVRIGHEATVFRPAKGKVGYYLMVLGKKPRIEYGVMTNTDIAGCRRILWHLRKMSASVSWRNIPITLSDPAGRGF